LIKAKERHIELLVPSFK